MEHPFPRRRLLAALVLGLALTGPAEAQPVVTSDDNAALRYLRAMTLLSDDTRGAVDRISDNLLEPTFHPAPEDRRAIASSSGTIDMLLRGAALPRSDFGIDWDLGPEALVPHLHDLRVAARLLLADARLRAEAGEDAAAAERLAGAFRMASHAGQDRLFISALVSASIAQEAAGVTNRLLDAGLLPYAARERVRSAAASLAGDDPFGARAAIEQEARMMTRWLREHMDTDGRRREAFSIVLDLDAATDEEAARLLGALTGDDAETYIDLFALGYRQAVAAWDSDDPERAFDALSEDMRSGVFGPIAQHLMPAFGRAKRNAARIEAELDALRRRLQE